MLRSKQEVIQEFFSDHYYYGRVVLLCKTLYRNDSDGEDAAHDIYITMIEHADRYNFPEDKESAFFYVTHAIVNERRMKQRKAGIKFEPLNELLAIEIADVRCLTYMQKLDKVNAIVQEHSRLFSVEQMRLWQCMYDLNTIDEMVVILDKKRETLFSLRNKIIVKVRALVHAEDLN